MNKLLAIDDAATFYLSEPDLQTFIHFLQTGLENAETEKSTHLSLLFLLREVIHMTSSTGSGSFVATVLCLSVDMAKTLLALDVEEHSSGRFGRNTMTNTGDDSDNLKLQQENTLECLFITVFQQDQLAYLLYSESGYMYLAMVCNLLCSPLSQNNPSSPLYWKTILYLFLEDAWVAYFGSSYLLALLAELMCPAAAAAAASASASASAATLSAPRTPRAVALVSGEILMLLTGCVTAGTLTLIEDPAWVEGK